MRIITISALALALSALGSRAQTTSTTDTSTTTNPAKPSSGAEDKGAATMPNTQSSGSTALPSTPAPSDKSASAPSDPAALPNDKPAASASDVPAAPSDSTSGTTVIKKHRKHNKGQGRSSSDTSGMHRAKTSGTDTKDPGSLNAPAPSDSPSGSVQRPAAPSTTTPDVGSTTGSGATKDPGMSRPGDVTGQPTDTQKPVDTNPDQSGKQPPNK